ncbi:M48 family metallopeptidase [Oscillatoria sp. CS-180]|uniref:M48 family metallopeptidase n=1 Tax=Oscillatoria sp. CS-180 TaxID=3021720 RepID=UPI00232DB958|nr:M48 family metallopeptidase [Oscillatoria sp. CS-180]
MNTGKRFLAWSLMSLFLTFGLNGLGSTSSTGWAAQPPLVTVEETTDSDAAPNSIEETTAADSTSGNADELTPPESDAATEPDEGVLNLPDFEPRLPGESIPDEMSAEEDESTWNDLDIESSAEAPKLSKQQQILITADEHYLAGDFETAEILYRQVKDAVWQVDPASLRSQPIYDPADLSPAGAVYWREANAGYDQGLTHRTTVPLDLLVREYPEFIPAHIFYAEYLVESDRAEEADAVLDQALIVYPSHPDLLMARTRTQMVMEQWIEASITARQFVLLNPDHPEVAAMDELSKETLNRFRAEMNEELTGNLLGNIFTGAAGLLLTGGLIGPYTAVNSAVILMQGESAVGASVAEQAKAQLPLISDAEVDAYVNGIGQKLASLTGRDEFNYEFYIIDDPELNAFALPGGKIFINGGAILKANSEAELAGLLAHELAHAVLSHGFQMATNSNLVNSVAGVIPVPEIGGIAAGLAFSSYSREMERQADILGTQLLSVADYAADGLHNLMVTLQAEAGDRGGIQWFSTHPAPAERVDYLKQIVEVGGYNRYAYEGVATHLAIQSRVDRLLTKPEETEGAE